MTAPEARPTGKPTAPESEDGPGSAHDLASKVGRQIELEAAILDELKRMNRLLNGISRGPRRYTLSFFSGITRGLGAVLGATVVFALFVGALSYLDTAPIIGSYVQSVLQFVQQNGGYAPSANGPSRPESFFPSGELADSGEVESGDTESGPDGAKTTDGTAMPVDAEHPEGTLESPEHGQNDPAVPE